MNTKGVNFQPSKRGQFSAAVDTGLALAWDVLSQDDAKIVAGHLFAAISAELLCTLRAVDSAHHKVRPFPDSARRLCRAFATTLHSEDPHVRSLRRQQNQSRPPRLIA